MRIIFFVDICDILSICSIHQDGYFHTNAFYMKFLNKFSLPDVASPVVPLLHVISFVVSVSGEGEGDEPNKVDFVLIDIHGQFT